MPNDIDFELIKHNKNDLDMKGLQTFIGELDSIAEKYNLEVTHFIAGDNVDVTFSVAIKREDNDGKS